ncbi:MAG: glycerol-3-phosphate dehydrogenase/oxidase [Gemmatimonadota bacterium]
MKRNPEALTARTFDVVVVGGGITGACVARDAARRGLSVALLEKNDFSAGTSGASSKLVHGGLRYLRNLEFGLVRESLRERQVWQRIAPHMVHSLRFLLPVRSARERVMSRSGLLLYDLLSWDRRRAASGTDSIARSTWLNRWEALSREPVLDGTGLRGAVEYGDCVMDSPERLAVECLIDASDHGASIANHMVVRQFSRSADGAIDGVAAVDLLTNSSLQVSGRVFVNATGPWADKVLAVALSRPPRQKIMRSRGIHLVVPPLTGASALLVPHSGGHFFVIPWRGHSLVGTTDTPHQGEPDDVVPSERDVTDFLAAVNGALPRAGLVREEVVATYAGLRPLIADGAESTYSASRRGEIADHAVDGAVNLLSALGGKWTTARATAEGCVDAVTGKLPPEISTRLRPCDTHVALLPGARAFDPVPALARDAGTTRFADVSAHLRKTFGAMSAPIFERIGTDPASGRRIVADRPETAAEVAHVCENEMAMTVADVIWYRTGIAGLGNPGREALDCVATLAAAVHGWSPPERARQVEIVMERLSRLR